MLQHLRSNHQLGKRIREIRKSKGLTQEQTTIKMQSIGVDISRSNYSKIEACIRHISVLELAAICIVLQVDYNTLFKGLCSNDLAE